MSDLAEAAVVIEVHGLQMTYHTKTDITPALKGVDLSIPKGCLQIIVGPSGAGKTTLLLILAGLLTPTAGQVQILGQEITHLSHGALAHLRLKHLGLMFQESNLLSALTALENVEVMLHLKGVERGQVRRQAQQLLDAVGLADHFHHLPWQLSGGQQQRVSIARALAGHPDILIADEPTAALDSDNGDKVMALIKQLVHAMGSSVVIATHDPRILAYGDRIAYLEDGTITPAH